jgi:hypothetical protein
VVNICSYVNLSVQCPIVVKHSDFMNLTPPLTAVIDMFRVDCIPYYYPYHYVPCLLVENRRQLLKVEVSFVQHHPSMLPFVFVHIPRS